MKREKSIYMLSFVFSLIAGLIVAGTPLAGEYAALDGLKNADAVFDVRGRNIKPIVLQLDLIHNTFHDVNIRNVSEKPEFAVVFGGGAVKLISSNWEEYDDGEKRLLGLIAEKLKMMDRDGIRLEVCEFAADVHDVDIKTIPSFIGRVDNGWISLIGYQQQGYSLVAIF